MKNSVPGKGAGYYPRKQMPKYIRNVQGRTIELELVEIDPRKVHLDPTNPRIRYAMEQLPKKERNEDACVLVLVAQEETEALKLSIIRSGGVQEPIYIRHDGSVAEGNRRVVATRLALEDKPHDKRYATIPAWKIPKGTPETVIQDLLNEVHIGSIRGWAPYEKAMQIRALVQEGGLIEEEVAERYRMTLSQVQQQIAAVDFMEKEFLSSVENPADPEHRSKYSYFLEFEKNRNIRHLLNKEPDLRTTFAKWVRDGKVNKGVQVRALPKILESPQARKILAMRGYKAAKEYLSKVDATEHDLYARIIEITEDLGNLGLDELENLKASHEQQDVLRELKKRIELTISYLR